MEENVGLDNSAKSLNAEAKRYSAAMELADGDESLAKDLMRPDNKFVLSIKSRFYESNIDLYGVCAIYYDTKAKMYLNTLAGANHDKKTFSLSPYIPWNQFRKKIEHMLLYGESDPDLVNDLKKNAEETISFSMHNDMEDFVDNGGDNIIKDVLISILRDSYGTQGFEIEFNCELINIVDYQLSMERGKVDKSEQPEQEKKSEVPGVEVIEVDPVVSPVHGQVIHNVKEGDMLFVRSPEEAGMGSVAFFDKMKAKYEVEDPKIPTVVKKVSHDEKGHLVLYVQLENNLWGKITETDPVRVQMVVPEDTKEGKQKKNKKKSNSKAERDEKESDDSTTKLFVYITIIFLVVAAVAIVAVAFLL